VRKIKTVLVILTILVITLAACQNDGNPDGTSTTQETSMSSEEEIADSVGMDGDINSIIVGDENQNNNLEDVTSSENYTLVWVVEPTLEYDFIYHCCFFSTGDHSGEFIDSATGLIIDWPQDLAFGHGSVQGWVYDPEVSLFGLGGVGDYSSIMLLSIDEWTDLFAQFGEQHGLMIVQLVDSSIRAVTEFSSEYLPDYAHSGKFAVMLNGIFITNFIFDGGSLPGLGSEILYYTIPMQIGDTWGFIDKNGDVAIPFLFEHIVRIDDETAFVRYNGRYGILNIPLTIANF